MVNLLENDPTYLLRDTRENGTIPAIDSNGNIKFVKALKPPLKNIQMIPSDNIIILPKKGVSPWDY